MFNFKFFPALLLIGSSVQMNAQVADAGPDQELCLDHTTLQANALMPDVTGYWTLLSGNVTIADDSDPTSQLTNIYVGANTLSWTIINGTDTTTDEVSIIRYEFDPAIADAGSDQTIFTPLSTAVMQAATPWFPQVCSWTVVSGTGIITNVNDPQTSVSSLGVGENIFQWTCDDGECSVPGNLDQVTIWVETAMSVSTIEFSQPTSIWYDQTTGLLQVNSDVGIDDLTLFDGSGRRIQLPDQTNGRPMNIGSLPSGTYVVIANIDGALQTQRFIVSR
ncbi:MAG: T9SS type A sorting domain-containing protein [Flavobacteriales bacterium]|nr:T9SS type A sorting domain-containing protein [Flavobacteriales bacterium]